MFFIFTHYFGLYLGYVLHLNSLFWAIFGLCSSRSQLIRLGYIWAMFFISTHYFKLYLHFGYVLLDLNWSGWAIFVLCSSQSQLIRSGYIWAMFFISTHYFGLYSGTRYIVLLFLIIICHLVCFCFTKDSPFGAKYKVVWDPSTLASRGRINCLCLIG